MSRKTLFAPALALAAALGGLAVPVTAQAYPRISGGDDDLSVTYGPVRGDTIVGGARARIEGGGTQSTYTARPDGQAREGRIGRLLGGGRDAAVQYQHGGADLPSGRGTDGRGG